MHRTTTADRLALQVAQLPEHVASDWPSYGAPGAAKAAARLALHSEVMPAHDIALVATGVRNTSCGGHGTAARLQQLAGRLSAKAAVLHHARQAIGHPYAESVQGNRLGWAVVNLGAQPRRRDVEPGAPVATVHTADQAVSEARSALACCQLSAGERADCERTLYAVARHRAATAVCGWCGVQHDPRAPQGYCERALAEWATAGRLQLTLGLPMDTGDRMALEFAEQLLDAWREARHTAGQLSAAEANLATACDEDRGVANSVRTLAGQLGTTLDQHSIEGPGRSQVRDVRANLVRLAWELEGDQEQ